MDGEEILDVNQENFRTKNTRPSDQQDRKVITMSYFTDYKRQMMGHNRYFEAPPHDYPVDFRRNNFEGAFHHQNHSNTSYNELPSRFSSNYGHGPAVVGSHMHGSYDNLMFHQNHHHMSTVARRSRESYQQESNPPAAPPYYYHNTNAGSPIMNQYYHPNESYRKDSAAAIPPYHHWMANGPAGVPPAYNNSQYYPPSVNYGNSSPYYPTPPPSASPAGNFYPSKSDHRLPNYDYDYYNKEKNPETPSNDHNQGYSTPYISESNNPASRTIYSPKMEYQVSHPSPDVEASNRNHLESQRTPSEQMDSPSSSESDNYQKTKDSTRTVEVERSTDNSSSSHHSTFFKKSESTGRIGIESLLRY